MSLGSDEGAYVRRAQRLHRALAFPLFLARKLNDQDRVLGSQSDEDDKTDLTQNIDG
jgi:hypothetical protein